MKRKTLLALLLVVLMATTFGAGRAYAAGCFTDTNTVAACWLKANGIATPYSDGSYRPNNYLTRADAANFLYRANKVPPRAGDLYISQALNSVSPATVGSVEMGQGSIALKSTFVGDNHFIAYLSIPTALYGKALYLKGVQLCYNAVINSASLEGVELDQFDTSAAGVNSTTRYIADPTSRTDYACRRYMFGAPSKLTGSSVVDVLITMRNTTASDSVVIYGLTAILSASGTAASLTP